MGYDHASFWEQTPHTLSLTLEAYNERKRQEHNDRAWLAWHVAALQRTQRLPPLRQMLAREARPSVKQSWHEMKLVAAQWAAALGGSIKKKEG